MPAVFGSNRSQTRAPRVCWRAAWSAVLAGCCSSAWAADVACADRSYLDHATPTVNVRVDNDLFGGLDQDQGYSNGVMVTIVSSNLVDYVDDPCLPRPARWLNQYLEWLYPAGFDQQNMVLGIGQALFTPIDRSRTDLIREDRPYAAALLVSLGYNARSGDRLRTSQLRLGVVGPSARGEQVQNGWHRIIGVDRFEGWDNQLRDELVLQLVHERMRRWPGTARQGGWGWDAIGHWGAGLGNLSTYANAGAEWRFGWGVPNDFGSSPLRPAGENAAPTRSGTGTRDWAGHLFATLDARWVLHNITLDGNTFKSSHSVDKRAFVADVGYGLAVTHGRWKLAFARYHRTREFNGQRELPVFGSFTVSRKF